MSVLNTCVSAIGLSLKGKYVQQELNQLETFKLAEQETE